MKHTEEQIQQTLKAMEHGMRAGSFEGLQYRQLGSQVWIDDSATKMEIEYRIHPNWQIPTSLAAEQAAQHSLFDTTQKQYRLDLAARAPQEEIDAVIGNSRANAAEFLGIPVEEYEAKTHYLIASVKARLMWADALIKEANK